MAPTAESFQARFPTPEPLRLAQNAEQQVFRSNLAIEQTIGFLDCQLQDFPRLGPEPVLVWRCFLPCGLALFDRSSDILERKTRSSENLAGQAFGLAHQSKKQVLAGNGRTTEL
jgi:hypothetical protein